MKQYHVGPHDPCCTDGLNAEDYVWLITWYESGDYGGDGLAAALRKDGVVEYKGLGHCSCYGPMDSWSSESTKVSLEEFLKLGEYDDTVKDKKRKEGDCDYERWQKIVNKAWEVTTEPPK
jgi:hypothetical protein